MRQKIPTVLLVDDDEAVNFINERVLRKTGVADRIVAVTGGQEALDYIVGEQVPDLILLDINMPGMSGWEFLEKFEQLEERYRTPTVIMMLTTSLNPDDEARGRALGVIEDFMRKPLTAEHARSMHQRFWTRADAR